MEVLGNDVPGAIGQHRIALLPGLQVAGVNWTGQLGKGFRSGAKSKLAGGWGVRAVVGLQHQDEPLWTSVL